MKTYNPLKQCPFCENSKGLTILTDPENESFYVHCPYCGCQGPEKISEEAARTSWNRRNAI